MAPLGEKLERVLSFTNPTEEGNNSLIVVSNRLPFVLKRGSNGVLQRSHSAGGLVTAVAPVVTKCNGKWIGWPGLFDLGGHEKVPEASDDDKSPTAGLKSNQVIPVNIPENDFEEFYNGFCNGTLWPLFHSFSCKITYDRNSWQTYQKVNDYFAEKTVEALRYQQEVILVDEEIPIVWIHDYQLLLCPARIRELAEDEGLSCKLGFFLHIPFPSYDMLNTLEGSEEILYGMLACDVIGFHIDLYSQNFLESCLRKLGCRVDFDNKTVEIGSRVVRVRTLPIGIPFDKFEECAKNAPKVNGQKDEKDTKLIISVDRVDYTKGLVQKVRAIEKLLEKHRHEYAGKLTFLQIGVPSRTNIKEYQSLHNELSREIGRVNGKFSTADWYPIQFMYKGLPQDELAAYYRDSDVALVTPLVDGMNLVAKEFVACQINNSGALVLSYFAGAAESMKEALMVNPYEVNLLADSLHKALQMSSSECQLRMEKLRARERKFDVHYWMSSFLEEMRFVESIEKPKLPTISLDLYSKSLSEQMEASPKLAVILGYDGTLVGPAPTPQQAVLANETREILKILASNNDVSVCIISGRSVADLRKMVGIKKITYAGNNGLEIVHPDGAFFAPPVPEEHEIKISRLVTELQTEFSNCKAWVENKGPVVTFHYRNVPKGMRNIICLKAVQIFKKHGFEPQEVPMAFEARPSVNWDVSKAAAYFLRSTYGVDWAQRCTVLYIGDIDDSKVMLSMKSFAFTISVGKHVNQSKGFKKLPDIQGVIDLLKWLEMKMLQKPQRQPTFMPDFGEYEQYLSTQMSIAFSDYNNGARKRRRSRTSSAPGKSPISLMPNRSE
ncbi:uncharacterized protein LOC136027360 [Artemia franciscana]|uniref:Trehalose-6-phosphate synthase n=1 Tax=Artemia franciscana TaxID=6661 RepID=A0AA88HI63_ARTSF|nr:hypothetical protein QYM36_013371 [Artemia franciscana]